eukprot:768330-Hanusia_phi.AAC.4
MLRRPDDVQHSAVEMRKGQESERSDEPAAVRNAFGVDGPAGGGDDDHGRRMQREGVNPDDLSFSLLCDVSGKVSTARTESRGDETTGRDKTGREERSCQRKKDRRGGGDSEEEEEQQQDDPPDVEMLPGWRCRTCERNVHASPRRCCSRGESEGREKERQRRKQGLKCYQIKQNCYSALVRGYSVNGEEMRWWCEDNNDDDDDDDDYKQDMTVKTTTMLLLFLSQQLPHARASLCWCVSPPFTYLPSSPLLLLPSSPPLLLLSSPPLLFPSSPPPLFPSSPPSLLPSSSPPSLLPSFPPPLLSSPPLLLLTCYLQESGWLSILDAYANLGATDKVTEGGRGTGRSGARLQEDGRVAKRRSRRKWEKEKEEKVRV